MSPLPLIARFCVSSLPLSRGLLALPLVRPSLFNSSLNTAHQWRGRVSFLWGGGDKGGRWPTFPPTTDYRTPLVSKHPAAPPPTAMLHLTLVAYCLVILLVLCPLLCPSLSPPTHAAQDSSVLLLPAEVCSFILYRMPSYE